jgi:hypothetical protein
MAASPGDSSAHHETDQGDQTTIELILVEFPWYFDEWESSSDDGIGVEGMDEFYSPNLTTIDEIRRWILGMVPYRHPEKLCRELKAHQLVTSTNSTDTGLDERVFRWMFETSDFSPLAPRATRRLEEMIEYYIPKYYTAFANTEIEEAEFLIGLTDDGEVTGAIVLSDLTSADVLSMVWDRVEQVIRSQPTTFGGPVMVDHYIHHVRQNLRVEMVEMDPELSMLNDWSDEFIRDQSAKICEYDAVHQRYMAKMRKLTQAIEYYRRGVEEMMNDPSVHGELVDFIMEHDPSAEDVTGVSELTPEVRKALVDRVMHVPVDPIAFAPGQISDENGDVRNMAYWITRIRDIRVDQLRALKPKGQIGPRPTPLYTSLMIRNPIQRLVSNLPASLKVVVIQVVFPGRLTIPFPPGQSYHRAVSYVDSNGVRRASVRYINSNGPSCI